MIDFEALARSILWMAHSVPSAVYSTRSVNIFFSQNERKVCNKLLSKSASANVMGSKIKTNNAPFFTQQFKF